MFEPIIGLEIHVELKTKSKMFCGCPADFFKKEPNTHCCPVCLGLPGALPVANKKAVEWCVMLGMALECQIPNFSKFDRKNYFYPDLPKGYQISQYDQPMCVSGKLNIILPDGSDKTIRIRRVHMEEDTGKLLHAKIDGKNCTLVDFNRSGLPLVEIVTEPDIRSSEEARIFLKKLHQIIRYLDISDADMEKGSMRLEPNISLRVVGVKDLPVYKVEVKNINSFAFAKKAIDFELKRHVYLLQEGKTPVQETRGWDEKKQITISQRSKEDAQDYRYFPDPDLPPLHWTEDALEKIKVQLPEMPDAKIKRFMKDYALSKYDSTILCDTKTTADYFEKSVASTKALKPKIIANWIINKKVDVAKTTPVELIAKISTSQQVSNITDDELYKIIQKIIQKNPKAVFDYKSGKESVQMFLVGAVMKEVKDGSLVEKIKSMINKEI